MAKTPNHIEFDAELARVQTLADGSPRFVLDGNEGALNAMYQAAEAKAAGAWFRVVLVAVNDAAL
jgi:rhamnose utilization protein RhaD (predicted bifunctional aldolase and dehydrogenase)